MDTYSPFNKEEEIAKCPEGYNKVYGGCSMYFHYLYNIYPSEIKNVNVEYLNIIKNFPDPTLKYVALYFYHIYAVAKDYFVENSKLNNNLACNILNRWLDQHRSFFTHSDKCANNKRRWETHIEELWKWLQNNFGGYKCERFNVFSNTTKISKELENFTCSNLYPEDFICYKSSEDDKKQFEQDCDRLKDLCNACYGYYKSPATFAQAQGLCETCPSLTHIIRFPFTSLGCILSNRGRNKNRFQQQFSEEMEYEEFERYRNNNQHSGNGISHLHYQSIED